MSPELVVLGGRNFSFAPCLIPLLEYRSPIPVSHTKTAEQNPVFGMLVLCGLKDRYVLVHFGATLIRSMRAGDAALFQITLST